MGDLKMEWLTESFREHTTLALRRNLFYMEIARQGFKVEERLDEDQTRFRE